MSRLNVNTHFLVTLKIIEFLAVVEAGGAQGGGAAAKIKEGAKKGLKVAEAGGKKLMDDFKSISAEVSGIFYKKPIPNLFVSLFVNYQSGCERHRNSINLIIIR